jgi:hypothetical protein
LSALQFGDNAWKPMAGTRQELAHFQRTEIERRAKVLESAGIESE